MKLIIKSLGPIRNNSVAIDLSRKFYVFVGLNNSGKTYVSQLLWTIFNQKVIHQFAEELAEKPIFSQIDFNEIKAIDVEEGMISEILEEYAAFLKDEMANTYNVKSTSQFIDDISISFDFKLDDVKKAGVKAGFNITVGEYRELEYLVLAKDEQSSTFHIEEKSEKFPKDFFDFVPRKKFEQDMKEKKKSIFIMSVINALLQHQHNTFFLPSSRLFYSTFYRYIYDLERKRREDDMKRLLDLVENRQKEDKIGIESLKNLNLFKRPYTAPVNNVFEKIYSLNQEIQVVSNYEDLVKDIVEIMGGDIVMKSFEGLSPIEFYFQFNKETQDLPMYLASSSVNQLTLLYLYLKYWVSDENNFLMIDEPEENLYPKNQILLLDLLIKFTTRQSNKVLITTHSPLMADAVNRYIYIDILKNRYRYDIDQIVRDKNLKYINPEIAISKEDIGIYFFTGDKIIKYEADDYGVYFRNFRETINSIDESCRILTDYIYLQEGEDN